MSDAEATPAAILGQAVWAWPPTVPPNTRTNTTSQLDAHPADHNAISDALNTLVQRGGSTLRGKPPWLTLTLTNGWTFFADSQFGTAAQVTRSGGMVHVVGILAAAATHTDPATTLPLGYRPDRTLMIGQNGSTGLQRIDYKATGAVSVALANGTASSFLSIVATFAAAPTYGIESGYDTVGTFYALGGTNYIDIGNGVAWGNNARFPGNGGGVGWGSGVWTANNTYALITVTIGGGGATGRPTFFGGGYASVAAIYAAMNDAARANVVPLWILYRDNAGAYSVYADVREWL